MIRWQSPVWMFALGGFTLALSGPMEAQSNAKSGATAQAQYEQPSGALNSIDPGDTAARLDDLLSRLRDPASLHRVQAVEAVAASNTIDADTANRILQEALDDKDPAVAEAALRALLGRGDEQLLQVRESDLERFPGETSELARVHIAAIHQDTPDLRELMRNGNALVQETAFEALASSDTAAAVESLKGEFADATSLHRLQTLELFIRSPYTNSSATLMPILKLASEDKDPMVQQRAKQVLAEKLNESRQNR